MSLSYHIIALMKKKLRIACDFCEAAEHDHQLSNCSASSSLSGNVPKATKPSFDVQKIAVNSMAAASLASALVVGPMADAVETFDAPSFGTSSFVAERVTREGLYREYDVDVSDQVYDDARSTYKSAKETKTKKGRVC